MEIFRCVVRIRDLFGSDFVTGRPVLIQLSGHEPRRRWSRDGVTLVTAFWHLLAPFWLPSGLLCNLLDICLFPLWLPSPLFGIFRHLLAAFWLLFGIPWHFLVSIWFLLRPTSRRVPSRRVASRRVALCRVVSRVVVSHRVVSC
jgi:hypothetical protein